MSRYQLRLLVLSLVAIVLIATVALVVVDVDRTSMLLVLLAGALAAMLALRYARLDEGDDVAGEYKPIVIDRNRDRSRLPVTPLGVDKLPAPADPVSVPPRARTSSSGPVDVAARLGASLEIAMRPPLPEPAPIPADQIPVAPESGLVIRKRTASAAPLSLASLPVTPAEPKLRGRVSFALTTAAFSGAGVAATCEDGFARLVKWSEVVGIVARRLPPMSPYDGVTFIDIVSTAGATLRILPWTDVTGHPVGSDPIMRARSLVQLLAAHCLDATLDKATKLFANGTGNAAQLPDEKTLTAHDRRLA